MTAAHCIAHQSYFSPIYDLNPNDYQLYFGRHYGATYQPMPQTEERSGSEHIEKIEVHPNFNQGTIMYNDIALIKASVQTWLSEQSPCDGLDGMDFGQTGLYSDQYICAKKFIHGDSGFSEHTYLMLPRLDIDAFQQTPQALMLTLNIY